MLTLVSLATTYGKMGCFENAEELFEKCCSLTK